MTSKIRGIKGNVLDFKFLEGPQQRLSENTVNSQPLSKLNLKQPKGHVIRSIQFWSYDSELPLSLSVSMRRENLDMIMFGFPNQHIIICYIPYAAYVYSIPVKR